MTDMFICAVDECNDVPKEASFERRKTRLSKALSHAIASMQKPANINIRCKDNTRHGLCTMVT